MFFEDYIWIDGLQIKTVKSTNNGYGIWFSAGSVGNNEGKFSNNIFWLQLNLSNKKTVNLWNFIKPKIYVKMWCIVNIIMHIELEIHIIYILIHINNNSAKIT